MIAMLRLREMDVFRRVMELGSITGAANALRISQPAASRLIKQAEERLGFPLFLRQRKRLIPTTEAKALFPETIGAFAAIDSVQRLAGNLKTGQSGMLTIASIPALASVLLPAAVQRFRTTHNGVSVRVLAVSAHESANLVADQRADLGLIIGPMTHADVAMSDLCTVNLGCVMPKKHPLARKAELRPSDLHDEPLIGLSPHLPLGVQAVRAFSEGNVPLRLSIEVTQTVIALALVRAGAGIALLDGFALLGGNSRGDLVLRPFKPAGPIVARALHPRHRPVTRLAREFSGILHTVVREMGLTRPKSKARA
jgi:DNA-binding transcriptional LysR family regulator